MGFASICEHVSSAFIFASKGSDQIWLQRALQKIQIASSDNFAHFPLAGISLLLKENVVSHQII